MEKRDQYAGFWRRLLALIIDYNLMMFAMFPVFVLGGLLFPNAVEVIDPYGLFSTERGVESTTETMQHADGSRTVIETSIVEKTVLGRWTYTYEDVEEHIANKTEHSRSLIDARTGERIDRIDYEDYILIVLLFYWTLAESGRHRASFGKRLLGIQVLDASGAALTWRHALGRNLGKLLSAFIFMIGFMMAGWTDRKQGLHDKLAGCLLVIRR